MHLTFRLCYTTSLSASNLVRRSAFSAARAAARARLRSSFFRFVEATEGRICVDDLDISKTGLTDLRSKLTIIPQDPTIFSRTRRSTLDVFDEYNDSDIFEALR